MRPSVELPVAPGVRVRALVWGELEQDHGSWLVQDEGGALYKVSTMP